MLNEVSSNIDKFIFGGRCDFCIVQDNNKPDSAFKFRYYMKKGKFKDCYLVSGSKNSSASKLEYLGCIKVEGDGRYTCKQAEKISDDGEYLLKGLLWVLEHIKELPDRVHIVHNGKCSVCGRTLTDELSVSRGIGPTCMAKLLK